MFSFFDHIHILQIEKQFKLIFLGKNLIHSIKYFF